MGLLDTVLGAANDAAGMVQAPFVWAYNDAKDWTTGEGAYKGVRENAQEAMNPPTLASSLPSSTPTSTGTGTGPTTIDQRIADFAKAQGLNPTVYTNQLNLQRQAASITGDKFDEKSTASEIVKSMMTDAQQRPLIEAQQAQQKEQQRLAAQAQLTQRTSDQQYALYLQAQTAKLFQPFADNIIAGGQQSASVLRQMGMPQQADLAVAGAQRLAGAYGAQALLSPATYYQTLAQQSGQSSLDAQYKQAQIQQAQAMANYYNTGTQNFGGIGGNSTGGASNGGFDINALKAELGG